MMWKHSRYRAIMMEGERSSSISMAKSRLSILAVVFIMAYLIVMLRVIDLAIVQGELQNYGVAYSSVENKQGVKALAVRRGDIYDKNGFLLATSLKTPSLFVDPSLVIDVKSLAYELSKIIPNLDNKRTLSILKASNHFGWIAHNITPKQQKEILAVGDPALGFEYEYKRVYPQGNLFAHLVGYTDRDGLGLSGIERGYNDVLSTGEDIHLTLDLRLQHVVRREVGKAIKDFTALAGVGIILDAKTGELLAGVSLPDFNLNKVGDANDEQMFNRISLGTYELGSMFKIFSTAALLDLYNVGMGKAFDARKPLRIGRFTINDYHAKKRILTIPEVFMYSSNIGSALMGKMIGGRALRAFYSDLGLLNPVQFDIREIGKPKSPTVWGKATTLTASYGHGVTTTPLQMASAVATIVNGGVLVTPKLVKPDSKNIINEVRVISEETSYKMRKLLRLVVTKGTGKNAEVKGFALGGKTGTADKVVNGRYDHNKLISSFVGAFPINDPKYILMVMVDDPKGNKKSYGYATAGWVAAPAIARIITSMASVLGMASDKYDPSKDLSLSLLQYIHNKKKSGVKKLVSY